MANIFMTAYLKPAIVLSTLDLLSHLIPMPNLWSAHYYSHFEGGRNGDLGNLSNHLKLPIK